MNLKSALIRNPNLPRWICHIRQRIIEGRLSLLTGAGVSMAVGAPSWDGLVKSLSQSLTGFSLTFERYAEQNTPTTLLTQYIYTRHIDQDIRSLSNVEQQYQNQTAQISWHNLIRSEIYRHVPNSVDEIISQHPYIKELAHLCIKCNSTITFNFDNILDQVALKVTPTETLPPKTTWSLPPIDKAGFPYIYHINGLLPQNSRMKTSPKLVFTEDSFLHVLTHSQSANSNITSNFTNNTFLLFGLSLEDHSLKSILYTNNERSPGSIHYIVHWLKAEDYLTSEQQSDITRFNFDSYGLVTIFLTSEEINEFLKIIQTGTELGGKDGAAEEDFRTAIQKLCSNPSAKICFKYYIVGPVASGKSTLLENLWTFRTIEEWPEATIPQLYQDHKDLTQDERDTVDQWVYRQLRLKNRYFTQPAPGIHIMDRAPLDLFAFSLTAEENAKKAKEVQEQVHGVQALADGEILFLETDPDELLDRQLKRGRIPKSRGGVAYDKVGLEEQSQLLSEVYKDAVKFRAFWTTPQRVAKSVLRHVLFEDYVPVDLVSILENQAAKQPEQGELFSSVVAP